MRPGPSGSQALGHPGAAGSPGRAENRVEACGLDLAWGKGEKSGLKGRVFSLLAGSWLDLSLVVAENSESPSTGD